MIISAFPGLPCPSEMYSLLPGILMDPWTSQFSPPLQTTGKKSFGNEDLTIDSPGHSFTPKGQSVHPCPEFPASFSNLYSVTVVFRHCAGPWRIKVRGEKIRAPRGMLCLLPGILFCTWRNKGSSFNNQLKQHLLWILHLGKGAPFSCFAGSLHIYPFFYIRVMVTSCLSVNCASAGHQLGHIGHCSLSIWSSSRHLTSCSKNISFFFFFPDLFSLGWKWLIPSLYDIYFFSLLK